jgi:hypothetical protein
VATSTPSLLQHHRRPIPASVTRSFTAMAVGATHNTLQHLPFNGRPGHTCAAHHSGQIITLLPLVVELQNNRVSLPAVNARVLQEVLKHPGSVLQAAAGLVCPPHRAVLQSVFFLVPTLTVPTKRLQTIFASGTPVEGAEGLIQFTFVASLRMGGC